MCKTTYILCIYVLFNIIYLKNVSSMRTCAFHHILYMRMCYPKLFLYKHVIEDIFLYINALSKIFLIYKNVIQTIFHSKRCKLTDIITRECFIQYILNTNKRIFYPKLFPYKTNVLSYQFPIEKYAMLIMIHTKIFYSLHFLYKIVLPNMCSMGTCVIEYILYTNKLSKICYMCYRIYLIHKQIIQLIFYAKIFFSNEFVIRQCVIQNFCTYDNFIEDIFL